MNTFLIVFNLNLRASVMAQEALSIHNSDPRLNLFEAKPYKFKIPWIFNYRKILFHSDSG